MKYVRVMDGLKSNAGGFEYKLDEINVAEKWNPNNLEPEEMGGFNFSVEDKIIRWLVRGDTIYDVEIPEGVEVIECESISTPNGVFRSNKIIITNPRKVTDEIAMDLYLKSNIPEKSYYKSLAGLAIRGHINTCKKLISDRVNKDNIDLVLSDDISTAKAQIEAWSCVSRITTSSGKITVYCYDLSPTTEIPVQIICIR